MCGKVFSRIGIEGIWESDGDGFGHTDYFDNIIEDIDDALKDAWNGVARPIIDGVFAVLGFEGEDIYATQVATTRIITEENIPISSIKLAVLRAIRSESSLIDNLQQASLSNPKSSLNVYTKYGRDEYIHGLPTSKNGFKQINSAAVDIVITNIESTPITVTSLATGIPGNVSWVKYYLQVNESYTQDDQVIFFGGDPWLYDTFTVDGAGNFDVQLKRTLIIPGSHDGSNNVSILVDTTKSWISNEWVGASISNTTDGSSGTITANTSTTITAVLSGGIENDWDVADNYNISQDQTTAIGYLIAPPINSTYYISQYTLDSDPSYIKFWVYLISDGTYPTLDITSSSGFYSDAEMLPIVPLREGFVSINSLVTPSPAYTTSKEILNTVNLNIDDLIDQVESSPDIALISNAFIIFALNIYTTSSPGKKALFILLSDLYGDQQVTKGIYDANSPTADPIYNSVSFTEQSFNTVIVFNYITKTTIAGRFGNVGEYSISLNILPNTPIGTNSETGEVTGGGINSTYKIRKMLTANTYEELEVFGLMQITSLLTENGKIRTHIIELSNDVNVQRNFIIPLPYYIFKNGQLASYENEALIYEALTILVYASDHTFLEYYETSAFLELLSLVIKVIAIVILIYSLGEAANWTDALWLLADQLLTQYALALLLSELLYLSGDSEIGRILSYASYIYLQVNFGAGNIGGLSSVETLLFSISAFTSVVTLELGYQADALQDEIDSWLVSATERQEELDKAQALLDNSTGLNLEEMLTYLPIDPYEAPKDFYQRTIHTPNPGVLVLSQIENYHQNLLKLPELDIHSFDTVSPYN